MGECKRWVECPSTWCDLGPGNMGFTVAGELTETEKKLMIPSFRRVAHSFRRDRRPQDLLQLNARRIARDVLDADQHVLYGGILSYVPSRPWRAV